MFQEHGYRTVSTRQIAAACGLTQPALYRHFATKQDLYVEVLIAALAGLHLQLQRIVAQGGDVVACLRQITHVLPVTWEDASQMFHDITHELDAAQRDRVASIFAQQIIAHIATLFATGIAEGLFRSPAQGGLDATQATFVLLRLLDDHDAARPRDRSPIQHADQMLDLMLHGLMLPPPSPR